MNKPPENAQRVVAELASILNRHGVESIALMTDLITYVFDERMQVIEEAYGLLEESDEG